MSGGKVKFDMQRVPLSGNDDEEKLTEGGFTVGGDRQAGGWVPLTPVKKEKWRVQTPKEARDSEAKYKPGKFQGSTICDSNHCSDAKGHAHSWHH